MDKEGDMYEMLIRAMAGESSDSIITSQEKRGQGNFVNSEMLPRKIISGRRDQFEKVGIVFGENFDDLFVKVVLPAGWKKIPTEHNMWSYLVDDKDRKRASIFYKAAFYDRDAHISIIRRYSYSSEPVLGWGDSSYNMETSEKHGVVKDGDTIIWKTDPINPKEFKGKWYEVDDELLPLCKKWINDNYPNWEDPLAYWD